MIENASSSYGVTSKATTSVSYVLAAAELITANGIPSSASQNVVPSIDGLAFNVTSAVKASVPSPLTLKVTLI